MCPRRDLLMQTTFAYSVSDVFFRRLRKAALKSDGLVISVRPSVRMEFSTLIGQISVKLCITKFIEILRRMGRACSTYVGEERCVQGFGGEA
jgi:hypothetical protein